MKILFMGGTGLISSACSELVLQRGHDLTLLNRSSSRRYPAPPGAEVIPADVHKDEDRIAAFLASRHFDAVVDWIAFQPLDIERDLHLFRGRTDQFVFISSASAYQKPPRHYLVTEETPLENPYWEYSRNKIACELRLMEAFRQEAFPVTIVRPSLTYGPGWGGRAEFGGQRRNGRQSEPVIRQKLLGFLNGCQTEKPGIKPRFRIFGCCLACELMGQLTGPL